MNGNTSEKTNYLIDTNILIRFLKGQTELFDLFDELENLFISSISVGELMYGAALSSKKDFNTEVYSDFCDSLNLLVPDADVAKNYGKVKAELKAKGHPIPENDIWIAATAISANLTLITADSDFEGISGLKVLRR